MAAFGDSYRFILWLHWGSGTFPLEAFLLESASANNEHPLEWHHNQSGDKHLISFFLSLRLLMHRRQKSCGHHHQRGRLWAGTSRELAEFVIETSPHLAADQANWPSWFFVLGSNFLWVCMPRAVAGTIIFSFWLRVKREEMKIKYMLGSLILFLMSSLRILKPKERVEIQSLISQVFNHILPLYWSCLLEFCLWIH